MKKKQNFMKKPGNFIEKKQNLTKKTGYFK